MESRKEKHDRYINKLEKHIESAKEASRYSSDRFDILIISLSTSALIFSIGFVNDIVKNIDEVNTSLLKTSWLFFVIAIILNLISQITGYYANKVEIKISNNLVRDERGKKMKGSQKCLEKKHSVLNGMTIILNGLSFVLFIGGIISIVLFFSNNI